MALPPALRWPTILAFFGVGSALTVLYRHRTDIDPYGNVSIQVYQAALWLGLGLIVLAALLSAWRLASLGILVVWRKLVSLLEPPRYQCRLVRSRELVQHHDFWERFFPGDVSSLPQNQAWYRKNDKLFWFLFEVTTRGGKRHPEPKLVGSFSIIPLTKKAAQQVAAEELVGPTLTAEHIAKGKFPSAVYIGGVVAEGFFAKAEILARLSERVEKLREKGITIYTRPVTGTGLRLVKKYDFQPTNAAAAGLKHIYRLGEPNENGGG